MRTANTNFDTTSGNPVGLRLPRNCLRGRPEPLYVRPARNQRRALEEEATCLAFISFETCDPWHLENFLFYCRPLSASLNQACALPEVIHGRPSVMASSSVSLVRAWAVRSSCLSFAQAFSMGFRSGE
jgi:hypothetical protein